MTMKTHRSASWTLAAIPYLLLSASQEAGIRTYVYPDGSGERAVYARAAPSRAEDLRVQLRKALPGAEVSGTEHEQSTALLWRDQLPADLSVVGDAECVHEGIIQKPLSPFTTHSWKETVKFDRGDATAVEVQGQGLAKLKYVVRMPGTITSSSPAGKTEGNRVEWDLSIGGQPQTFTVESRTVRWPYLLLWAWVLAFVLSKVAVYAPRVAKRIPRRPKKI